MIAGVNGLRMRFAEYGKRVLKRGFLGYRIMIWSEAIKNLRERFGLNAQTLLVSVALTALTVLYYQIITGNAEEVGNEVVWIIAGVFGIGTITSFFLLWEIWTVPWKIYQGLARRLHADELVIEGTTSREITSGEREIGMTVYNGYEKALKERFVRITGFEYRSFRDEALWERSNTIPFYIEAGPMDNIPPDTSDGLIVARTVANFTEVDFFSIEQGQIVLGKQAGIYKVELRVGGNLDARPVNLCQDYYVVFVPGKLLQSILTEPTQEEIQTLLQEI